MEIPLYYTLFEIITEITLQVNVNYNGHYIIM